jgi:hypothetical protein
MIIYCSKRLETFLRQTTPAVPPPIESKLGDWNGHFFTVKRKQCIVVMNNKSCYSVILLNIVKKDVNDFARVFKERFIEQLNFDLPLKESQEILIRQALGEITIARSNNDKRIFGTINHHVEILKLIGDRDGGIENTYVLRQNHNLNIMPVTAKIEVPNRRFKQFFVPKDVMADLIKKETLY